jgi:hypothetical protein
VKSRQFAFYPAINCTIQPSVKCNSSGPEETGPWFLLKIPIPCNGVQISRSTLAPTSTWEILSIVMAAKDKKWKFRQWTARVSPLDVQMRTLCYSPILRNFSWWISTQSTLVALESRACDLIFGIHLATVADHQHIPSTLASDVSVLLGSLNI